MRNDQDWQRRIQTVTNALAAKAGARRLATYGEIAPLVAMGPGDYVFWHLLGDVSRYSAATHNVLLSAIVVNQATGIAGADFYPLAADVGRKMPKSPGEQLAFWTAEVARVFQAFAAPPPRAVGAS